jgi:NADPH:quinone reductase-like Zn-dependent oxidoreductase
MKSIQLVEPGSAANLIFQEISIPQINTGEVLIKVESISINPVDFKTRQGGGIFNYGGVNEQLNLILGWDISGMVTASNSDLFKIGDEVFGMVNFPGVGNAYAEYVAAPARHLALKPANITHEEAPAGTQRRRC